MMNDSLGEGEGSSRVSEDAVSGGNFVDTLFVDDDDDVSASQLLLDDFDRPDDFGDWPEASEFPASSSYGDLSSLSKNIKFNS